MARIIHLEGDVFVAPQISEEDFAEIAALGFRSVVCNRPDGEAEDQLPSGKAQAAAKRHGIDFRYQPVVGYDVTEDDAVAMFRRNARELQGPILFYCRSGTRCTLLWAQNAVNELGVSRTVEIAGRAGFDLSRIIDILEEKAASKAEDGSLAA